MSTHNKCFRAEIRKEISGHPLLSVAMLDVFYCIIMYFTSSLDFFYRKA